MVTIIITLLVRIFVIKKIHLLVQSMILKIAKIISSNCFKLYTDGKYITVMQKPSIPQDVVYRIIRYPDYTETKIYYWIITVSNDSVIGPLCYIDFLTECQDRKISEELRF